MTERTISDHAEYLSRRRARMLPLLGVMYIIQQGSFLSALNMDKAGGAYGLMIAAWAVLSVVILMVLVTKGFWFKPNEVRDVIDDEHTRANRLDGIRLGFILAVVAALGCYFIDRLEPLATGETVQIVLSFGLGSALLRFAYLERRA